MDNHLSSSFLDSFKRFEEWHQEKKDKLTQNTQLEYLHTSFPTWEKEFRQEIDHIGQSCLDMDMQLSARAKAYVKKSTLYQDYLKTPYYWQIINKPRGYAGDADMMQIIYRNQFEGRDNYAKFIHKLATECEACHAVRNRRKLLFGELQQVKGNILSLAAGPASEILDTLKQKNGNNKYFTALDHDIKTLLNVRAEDESKQIDYGILNAFHLIKGERHILTPREKYQDVCTPSRDTRSWRRLLLPLKYRISKLQKESYDFIYSAGLYDYINTFQDPKKGTTALTANLFKLLKPGGQMIIGNFSQKNPIGIKWVMEYICDWHLIYRTAEEMFDFTNAIPSDQIVSTEVIQEPTGINLFLRVQKRG